EVERMLVAHGQRTTAPLELYKLEEQRVTSEFRPKMENAMLRLAAAEAAVKASPTINRAEIAAAQAEAAQAGKEATDAAAARYRYETRGRNAGSWALPAVTVGLFALGIGGLVLAASRPGSRGAYFLGAVMAFVFCGVAGWAVRETGGTEATAV